MDSSRRYRSAFGAPGRGSWPGAPGPPHRFDPESPFSRESFSGSFRTSQGGYPVGRTEGDSMDYDTFVDQIAQRTDTPAAQAVELTRAVLETLAERLTGGEVLDLAVQLPAELQGVLKPGPDNEAAQRLGATEFVTRVTDRAHVDEATAHGAVRAVFTTLREAISGGEFDDVAVQLPRDYRELVEPALAPGAALRRP
ncbi:hypothetical protein Strop_2121 [Salinispora tropica CNB-440]|uniref:DUF2267 domain-containing protein n=2 Tax=Salinispora tropica TaxID=168695 RepID=A4X6S2_SALTO|nr:hypothetical protein Strop_2121 [Salinispora tropica CNB-440]